MSVMLRVKLYAMAVSKLFKKGDPKTLTSGPWTPLRTGSMDCLTDRSTDYLFPLYGPPQKTKLKINNNWKLVYTGCLDRPLLPVKSSRYAFSFAVDRSASKLSSSAILFWTERSWSLGRVHKPAGEWSEQNGGGKERNTNRTYLLSVFFEEFRSTAKEGAICD